MDHALSEEFRRGFDEVLRLPDGGRAALMYTEKHYWRCHRRIISDHLVTRRVPIFHILKGSRTMGHRITGFAFIRDKFPSIPHDQHRPRKFGQEGCVIVHENS